MVIKEASEIIKKDDELSLLDLPEEVIFERLRIPLPIFREEMRIREMKIVNLENEIFHLRERLNEVTKSIEKLELYRNLSNEQAEKEIKEYLVKQKKQGINKISILNIIENLRLPVEQIESIMDKLKSKGVREIE